MSKKAEAGISIMIILLAIILISTIAATLIVKMGMSTSAKGNLVGNRVAKQVGTVPQVIYMYGENGTDSTIEYLYMKTKVIGASDDVALADITIEVDLNNASAELSYTNESCTYDSTEGSGDGFYSTTEGTGTFTTTHLLQGDRYKVGFIKRGDLVLFCIDLPRSVRQEEEVKVKIIAKSGSTIGVWGLTPRVMANFREKVYPH